MFDLLEADSKTIISDIENKDLTNKPGWVRLSLHPTTTDVEVDFICDSILQVVENVSTWTDGYRYNPKTNEFDAVNATDEHLIEKVKSWFDN